jgi:DnaJ-class molecular chaperone
MDEMQKLRESIPPKDRCEACDGFGLIAYEHVPTYRVCTQCNGTGRKLIPPKQIHPPA